MVRRRVRRRLKRGEVAGAEELELTESFDSLDDAVEHAHSVLDLATKESRAGGRWVLFSGGNDSLVLLHVLGFTMGIDIAGVIHVNTGIGVPETNAFAREVVEDWGFPFYELHPPRSYEQLFVDDAIIDGLPGPGMHHIAYTRLKERPLAAFVQEQKESWWDRLVLLTGIRFDESKRRMGYGSKLVTREGAQVWANPIYYFSNDLMAKYRADNGLPINPVSVHLHMSGECLCGSFAHPGELDEIAFFYPEVAERIRGIERAALKKGLTYHHWGEKRSDTKDEAGPMCSSCEFRNSVREDAVIVRKVRRR